MLAQGDFHGNAAPRPKKAAPAPPPDTYTKRWKAAFKDFELDADALKVTDVVAKKSSSPIDVAFHKKVSKALDNKDLEKAIRKAELAIPGAHLDSTHLGKLQYAVQAVMGEYLEYEKLMLEVIEIQGKQLDNPSATKYKAGLKELITLIKAIHRDLKQEITKARMAGIVDEHTATAFKENAEANITRTKAAVARAMVFIQKARAAPDKDKIAFFNENVQKAARDITTQLGTLDKLTKQGFKFDRAEPKDLFEALSPWASYNRKVGAHGGDDDFNTEVALFEKFVRAAGDWAN